MTKASKITYTAVFAAIATVLMYFEFPIPFMPPFLKVDLSGAVVLIGAFIFWNWPGDYHDRYQGSDSFNTEPNGRFGRIGGFPDAFHPGDCCCVALSHAQKP